MNYELKHGVGYTSIMLNLRILPISKIIHSMYECESVFI